MKAIVILLFLLLSRIDVFGQKDTPTLSVNEVLQIVKLYHPVVKQAAIGVAKSQSEITIARGSFNPVFTTQFSGKTFDSTLYYQYFSPGISIPTWFGIELNAGLGNITGDRLDPTETVGQTSYLGATIPLLKNLVMDKRRAMLAQAKLFREMAANEQKSVTNTILMEAAAQYWEWVNAYQCYYIIKKNLEVSLQRFILVKNSYINGERPAIDTVEAMLQYQNFQYLKNEYWLQFQNEGLKLSAYLWAENNLPVKLPDNVIPQKNWDKTEAINVFEFELNQLLVLAQDQHPDLNIYNQKLDILAVERKLKSQELLPKLDLTYNVLNKGYSLYPVANDYRNNSRYYINFSVPLFLSNGRGEFKRAQLKIQETQWSQKQKSLEISLKIRNYHNEYLTYKNLIALQSDIVRNYKTMLSAEETMFKNGESSLFLINARENKVLESEKKLSEVITKYYKTVYTLKWSAGLLN